MNIERPTSNVESKTKTRARIPLKELRETQRWLKLIQRVPLIKKPELLDDILLETEELIKIFVTSIKTAVRQAHGPERSRRAEKKRK